MSPENRFGLVFPSLKKVKKARLQFFIYLIGNEDILAAFDEQLYEATILLAGNLELAKLNVIDPPLLLF
jgi:hypothetical protein